MARGRTAFGAMALVVLFGCGGVADPTTLADGDGGSTSNGGNVGQGGGTTVGQGTTVTSSGSSSTGGGPVPTGGCFDAAPDGAALPPATKPYSGGTCPQLSAGSNTLSSQGNMRSFVLVLPEDQDDSEVLPVAFLWHWLGGDAQDFLEKGAVQDAVNKYRFAAVIPETKGDVQFKWPVEVTQSSSRVEEEMLFFDDMLSCVSEQVNVNASCVSSVGVSAGALFTSLLAGGRGEYLSSILVLSGGVGGVIKGWSSTEHKMPAMVLWGGPSDNCFGLMDFQQTSKNLESALESDGHFFLECIHNCGHAEPPLTVPDALSKFTPLWSFIVDHPYWLEAGSSPYLQDGIPATMPEWCGIGKNSAEIRTGACTEEPGC